MVEQQMLEEDENVDEVLEEEEEQELEPGEGEYLTMASILTVVPSLANNETEEEIKEEEDVEEDGREECGLEEDRGNFEDKEVEEINRVDQQKKELEETR